MKRTTIIVLSGLTLIFFFYLEAFAVFDPPHNEASSVSCGSCHGKSLEIAGGSPFWTDNQTDTAYNAVCLRCHITTEAEAEEVGYSGNSAPVVESHAPGGTAIKCTVCHHNHEQEQIYPGKYNQGNFFVATGSVDSIDTYDSVNKTTTINYSLLTGKGDWVDLVSLAAKTGASRGAMLVPDISATSSRWPVYMIAGIDIDPDSNPATPAGTITVKGEITSASNLGIFYGQQVRSIMRIGSGTKYVEFYDKSGAKSFVNPTPPYGICQVCHENQGASTGIKYWRNDGSGISHNTGKNCMGCHLHTKGINHNGSDDCSACHSEHHASSNVSLGNCEYCHADPRPSMMFWDDLLPGDNGNNYGTFVPTQMACLECHVKFEAGQMRVIKFTRTDYEKYTVPYVEANAHIIANADLATLGRINNYGICLSCHNGSIAAAVTVWHARPDVAGSGKTGAWVWNVSDDRRCTGTAGNDSEPFPPNPLSWALHAPGRSLGTNPGTIGSFNLFQFPGFGDIYSNGADPCSDRGDYTTSPLNFQLITIPAVPGNGNTSGSVPVFASVCRKTPGGDVCGPTSPPSSDVTETFNYIGNIAQTHTIPANATDIWITVKGAGGGGGHSSNVGLETNGNPGNMVVMPYGNPGITLSIYVGEGGTKGGENAFGYWLGADGGWGYPSLGFNGYNGEEIGGGEWGAAGGAGGGGASSVYFGGIKLAVAKGGTGGRSDNWFDPEEGIFIGGSGGAGGGKDYYTFGTRTVNGGGAGGTTAPTNGGNGQVVITYNVTP